MNQKLKEKLLQAAQKSLNFVGRHGAELLAAVLGIGFGLAVGCARARNDERKSEHAEPEADVPDAEDQDSDTAQIEIRILDTTRVRITTVDENGRDSDRFDLF